jgi:UDP-N-acetylmuramate--alanine ligase
MELQGHHIHFVCVGGIGMSALAHMALDRGATVSGCDLNGGAVTRALAERGVTIRQGHDPSHLDGVELVVRSSAISEDAPEIAAAFHRHIPVIGRARCLAHFTDQADLVAVTGTHGKTTTTWLAGKLLIEAGLDPSVVVGGRVAELGGTYRLGTGDLFVAEVDESDRSLLEFSPCYSIVTNIEHDHVDCYPTLGDVEDVFLRYLRRTTPAGCAIACVDSPAVRRVLRAWGGPALTYGFAADAQVRAERVRLCGASSTFDAVTPNGAFKDLSLALPGKHNVQNALAAVALGYLLDIPEETLRRALAGVRGVNRRLEDKGTAAGIHVYDDYAHHTTEIQATIAAARGLLTNGGRLVAAFQPHRYSRTQSLATAFGRCFDALDHLVVLPIYGAGEAPIDGVTSADITRAVSRTGEVGCRDFGRREAAEAHLLDLLRPGDTLMTLGAGDVYQLGESILATLQEHQTP